MGRNQAVQAGYQQTSPTKDGGRYRRCLLVCVPARLHACVPARLGRRTMLCAFRDNVMQGLGVEEWNIPE